MASQSPDAAVAALSNPKSYTDGWAALARLIELDYSWSGHERNCVFLNRDGGDFVDRSALSGLDFDDDGRACAAFDFDGDGDLDIVFKNRSAPQLRFVRNDRALGDSLFVRLRDDTVANRSAIGARVELVAGDRRLVRCVTAGEGYLGQASRWLHFGLAGLPPIDHLVVRWPDSGQTRFTVPAGTRHALAVRAAGDSAALEPREFVPRRPAADVEPLPELPTADAVVLRQPLLLPPTLARVAFRGQPQRPVLLVLWSRSCVDCRADLGALAARRAELEGVDLVFLGLHEAAEQAKAAVEFREFTARAAGMRQRPASAAVRDAITAVLTVTLGRDELTTPLALLVDARSHAQVIYVGGVDVDAVIADAVRFGHANTPGPLRSRRAGRWAFAVERSLAPLIEQFAARGLRRDAEFFARLLTERRGKKPPK